MKFVTILFSTLFIATSLFADTGLTIGDKIPSSNIKMKNVDGTNLTIADVKKDKGTLVIFTCNHCPWVKAWESRITEIGNSYLAKGVGVIAINSNDPSKYAEDSFDEMVKRSEKLGLQFPYVVDKTSEIAKAFGASKTPEVYLFDNDDKLVYMGTIDDNAQDEKAVTQHYLTDALNAVVKGNTPPLAVTKALGCGIKFR